MPTEHMPTKRMSTEQLTYVQAINTALRHALRDDETVLVYGEDIGLPGGVFGATKGLQREFGQRVFDTPISEAAILGAAVGAAQNGMRPVAEIMWSDFSLVALDQLVNQAANVRYVSNNTISAPLTVRMQQGILAGSCAQHSQSLEAIFAHIPGLRVCLPSTPQDAYDLLRAAIACDDPVVVIEHRSLYFGATAPVETNANLAPIGGAAVRRTGQHATMVSWGPMVHECLAAAEKLAEGGTDLEVIDLRWLNPLDEKTIYTSIKKTSRLAIAHQANVTAGFGAEVAARVAESSFFDLDAPIMRIGLNDMRVPAAPHLQEAVVPNAATIAERVEKWLNE